MSIKPTNLKETLQAALNFANGEYQDIHHLTDALEDELENLEEPRAVCWVYPEFFRQLDKSHCGVAYRFQDSDDQPRTPLYASPWPTGWISMKDRWPPSAPFNEPIAFYSPDLRNPTDTWIGIYRDGKFFSCGVEVVNVTHWMPQPIPPVAQENKA